jgi:hypothetical protein
LLLERLPEDSPEETPASLGKVPPPTKIGILVPVLLNPEMKYFLTSSHERANSELSGSLCPDRRDPVKIICSLEIV